MASILKHVVTEGEGSSKLGILSSVPPLSLFDMFIATKKVQKLICSNSPSSPSLLEVSLFAKT